MRISKERLGVKIFCDYDRSEEGYKNSLQEAAHLYGDLYIPADTIQEENGYSFFIAHRQSVKEYITKNCITIEDFGRILRRIEVLFEKLNDNFFDLIFDYECVFVGGSIDELEFVYAPERTQQGRNSKNNRCSDMLCIISLMIKFNTDEEEMMIKEILSNLACWEDEYLKGDNDNKESLTEIVNRAFMSIDKNTASQLNITNQIIFYIKNLITRIFTLLEEKTVNQSINITGENYLSDITYNGSPETICLGRDDKWADIVLLPFFISRKHAMIFQKEGRWYIKDMESANGTFVNNKRIDEGESVRLKNNSTLHFGMEECLLRVTISR